MEQYTFLRELADSWVLLAMTLFYLGACLRVFLPSRRTANAEAAEIPFRNETLAAECGKGCAGCTSFDFDLEEVK